MRSGITREAVRWRATTVSLVIAATAVLAQCHADSPTSAGTRLAFGTWGGENLAVIAADTVTHVHFGCTFGDFSGTVALDASGRFSVNGSYMLHAFPIAVGPSMPAQTSCDTHAHAMPVMMPTLCRYPIRSRVM